MALLALQLALPAQVNVNFEGSSENAAGKRIGLYGYTDMLTREEVLLDEAVIDSVKGFSLGCYVTYPRLVFLQVENYSQSFYIEPGHRYVVHIPQFEWEQDERRNVFLDPVALPLEFIGLPENELNLKIGRFEEVVDSFISARRVFFDIKFKPRRQIFDTLMAEVALKAPDDGDAFFERYKSYRLAGMRLALRFESRKNLIANHVYGQVPLYHDENYMELFLDLYKNSISKGTNRIPKGRIVDWVQRGDLLTMVDSVGLDPLLRNEQVRELALLEALKEAFYDRQYDRAKVRQMVKLVGMRSKFDVHRKLADRLVRLFDRGESGSVAPRMVLPDVDRWPFDLDALKGKWIYLGFVRVGDPHSLAEIETMAHFRDSVYSRNKDVVFVTVACDREFQKMYHFLKNNRKAPRYNWTWLHFDGNYRILERYGVVSYPTFVLINPEGKLHYSVTPTPGSGFLLHAPWEKKAEAGDGGAGSFF